MPGVLTTGSTVTCGHGGAVSPSGSAKLTVGGEPVLLKAGIETKSVSTACSITDDKSHGFSKCTKVLSVTDTLATKLFVGTNAVVLEPLKGTTDGINSGTPQDKLTASGVQTKLTAT